MRVLAISSAAGGCQVALAEQGAIVAARATQGDRALAAAIAPMLAELLSGRAAPDGIGVVVGPGSFTGLRAGIAAAMGLGLGHGIAVVGVTMAEALAESVPALEGRALWIALDSRRGHIFLDTGAGMAATAIKTIPPPPGAVAVAGDAAVTVAAHLAARGTNVLLTEARAADVKAVAAVAARRLRGEIAALPPLPLYVDPPSVTHARSP